MVNLISLRIYLKSQFLEAKILFMERAHLLSLERDERDHSLYITDITVHLKKIVKKQKQKRKSTESK